MKIKNIEVEEFATFLLNLKLKGKENRMRNKLVKIIQHHLRTVQEEHKDLLNEYCDKDSNGNYKTITNDDKTFYDIEDVVGFQKEYEKLLEEFCYIPNDEANMQMLSCVKDIILNCENEFSGREALRYETYCELFEKEMIITT